MALAHSPAFSPVPSRRLSAGPPVLAWHPVLLIEQQGKRPGRPRHPPLASQGLALGPPPCHPPPSRLLLRLPLVLAPRHGRALRLQRRRCQEGVARPPGRRSIPSLPFPLARPSGSRCLQTRPLKASWPSSAGGATAPEPRGGMRPRRPRQRRGPGQRTASSNMALLPLGRQAPALRASGLPPPQLLQGLLAPRRPRLLMGRPLTWMAWTTAEGRRWTSLLAGARARRVTQRSPRLWPLKPAAPRQVARSRQGEWAPQLPLRLRSGQQHRGRRQLVAAHRQG